MIIYDQEQKIMYSTKINDSRYFSGFGTKEMGDATNIGKIISYFDEISLEYNKLVTLEQIHSSNISFFESTSIQKIEKIEETDGAICKNPGVILTVRTADCLPIIYCDKKNNLIGISHNGWRGSIKRLAQKMIDKMISLGSNLETIRVAIGPGIGACCYDIDDDRYYNFLEEFDGYSDKIFQIKKGKRYISLSKLNYLLLADMGVKPENIDFFPFCTKCDKEKFFSYRRDNKKDYGEMLSFIVKR